MLSCPRRVRRGSASVLGRRPPGAGARLAPLRVAGALRKILSRFLGLFWSKHSAICTAFKAAPLRRLSPTTKRARPWRTVGSWRMRPTNTGSRPLGA